MLVDELRNYYTYIYVGRIIIYVCIADNIQRLYRITCDDMAKIEAKIVG